MSRCPGLHFCFPFLHLFQWPCKVGDPKYGGSWGTMWQGSGLHHRNGHPLTLCVPSIGKYPPTESSSPPGSQHHHSPFTDKETEAQRSSVAAQGHMCHGRVLRLCPPQTAYCSHGFALPSHTPPQISRWSLEAGAGGEPTVGLRQASGAGAQNPDAPGCSAPLVPPASSSPEAPAVSCLLFTLGSLLVQNTPASLSFCKAQRIVAHLKPFQLFSVKRVLISRNAPCTAPERRSVPTRSPGPDCN